MPKLLSIFSIILGSAVTSVALARGPVPIHPATAWANTYLMNTVFALDYGASLLAQSPPDHDRAQLAAFASAEAERRSQVLPHAKAIRDLAGREAKPLSFGDIGAILARRQAGYQSFWESLAHSYDLASHNCSLEQQRIDTIVQHQKTLQGAGDAMNGGALVEPLAAWTTSDVRCLFFAMLLRSATGAEAASDPLALMLALRQMSSPVYNDVSIRIAQAIRLLQIENYPEALRVLLDLRDQDPAYRLAYDLVQRAYSVKQKGQGAVSLRGF